MNKKMMDILACPMDKHFPLEIFELQSKGDLIVEGCLYCHECSRFYPVVFILLPTFSMPLGFVAYWLTHRHFGTEFTKRSTQ